ncbi:hypothetical protein HOO54_04025 [Bacillus sp. WMMC1349]|uniref:hypothetical protein n=1 Tax=Bacillus sp. WMMC1349 TaxID=2736254 RepID=UPI001553FB7C|nr:hypothetical protein [Bacillus sp. WMMC1349]NPC91432.1 hypothetical protein [Bacillus sp. WMMC1349]
MFNLCMSECERMMNKKFTIFTLILFPIILLFLLFNLQVGQYDYDHYTKINSLNFSVFFISKLFFVLNMILIPIFTISSLNGEYTTGRLRMVAIRPNKLINILISKWMILFLTIVGIVLVFWLLGLVGKMLSPHVTETTFYFKNGLTYQSKAAFFYELKYYMFIFMIMVTSLGLSSLFSLLFPNVIMSYIVYLVGVTSLMYIKEEFALFIVGDKFLFDYFHEDNVAKIALFFCIIMICSFSLSLIIWKKRKWMK